jgi:hypothetical protein
MGFTIAGYRKHYYADGEDALLMTLSAKALLHSDIFSDNSSDVI